MELLASLKQFIKHSPRPLPIYSSMKNTKRIAVIDPYLDVMGGGEKHILSIVKIFDELGFQIDLQWENKNILHEIEQKLDLKFDNLQIVEKITDKSIYEYLFYITDGSYFLSNAKNNYVFCMYPKPEIYNRNLLNAAKWINWSFFANSNYTRKYIETYTGKDVEVIYPYITKDIEQRIENKKKKVILSVGRFFQGLHSKRHDVLIQAFNRLQQDYPEFADYKLNLVGGLKEEDGKYFKSLETLAHDNKNIRLITNVSNKDLVEYYKSASIYWHAAGYEVDVENHPECVEHFGITPLEAMKYGLQVFCYNAGGPAEIIENGKTGFLWKSIDELCDMTYNNQKNRELIVKNASEMLGEKFSYEVFKEKVIKYFKL